MNIHILIKKCLVVGVYDLFHPEVGDMRLEPELDYKMEYFEDYENMEREGK